MRGDEFFRQAAGEAPFSKLHPGIAAFFKDYLANEKVVRFNDRYVVNTHFPPYPSFAFDNLVENFGRIGDAAERRVHSVTLGVTNRCPYNCWHCYNAGRSQQDLSPSTLKDIARRLQDLGTILVAFSGGEPLLRKDLEELAGTFDDRTCLTLNTTGAGLTPERARALKDSGVFAVGVSLDSIQEEEHDRMRGKKGAFQTALNALEIASQGGLYPYIVSVATREFLNPDRFWPFLDFAAQAGAWEVHLLEPCATGKLAGETDVLLKKADRQRILDYQKEVAQDDNLPILSTYTYLESPEAFGCGAGLTHLYIDGSGEVCPCNLIPISFGNVTQESLDRILDKMACHFCKPRASCVGRLLARHIPDGQLPTLPEISHEICREHLPQQHAVPRFFQIRSEVQEEVGQRELQSAYDQIHEHYDAFWVKEAGKPVVNLINKLPLKRNERVLEAGCGTGFATLLLAGKLGNPSNITAVDLSEGMLTEARKRAQHRDVEGIRFVAGDALQVLDEGGPFDLIFSSWVLGYIPLRPFFTSAVRALSRQGHLAFVVHKENSPREPLEIFGDLVAQDPSVLQKRVAFDFPRDMDHVRLEVKTAGLRVENLWEGTVIFRYDTPEQVLEHLLKSGAGTAFYDAIHPDRRDDLTRNFLKTLADRQATAETYEVIHDYIACIAAKP